MLNLHEVKKLFSEVMDDRIGFSFGGDIEAFVHDSSMLRMVINAPDGKEVTRFVHRDIFMSRSEVEREMHDLFSAFSLSDWR